MSDMNPIAIVGDVHSNLAEVQDGRLMVKAGPNVPSEALHVVLSSGDRKFYITKATNSALPASLTSVGAAPYNIGGTTLGLTVDGGPLQQVSFASRAALAGYAVGGSNPVLNGDKEKIKVSINGGALLEVKIGKNHATHEAIAAALQAQIRALVPNGANVTVDYNVTNPLCYTVKSGTTGASSSVRCAKGGDDLAIRLRLMPGEDYTEMQGLDADNYNIAQVVSRLTEVLQGTFIENDATSVILTTQSEGSSSSLLVTSGGANTALQFPTTQANGQAGSGSSNLAVNGLATPLLFTIPVPENRVFNVTKLTFHLVDGGADQYKKFGGLEQLANGVVLEFFTEDLPSRVLSTFRTNGELLAECDSGGIMVDVFANNDDLVKGVFSFDMAAVRVRHGTSDRIRLTVQDDLSNLTKFEVIARGWIE